MEASFVSFQGKRKGKIHWCVCKFNLGKVPRLSNDKSLIIFLHSQSSCTLV